jgi:hypothetical protein
VPIASAATAVDHDNGIYVLGTGTGELYVVDEAGNSTMTSLGAGIIRDVRIENDHIAVAIATEVVELSLTGLNPTVLWTTTPSGATAVVSVDLSEDGAYVAYLAQRTPFYTNAGEVGVLAGADGSLVDSLYTSGYRPTNAWLDATGDMEYIAVSHPTYPPFNRVGVGLYSFDGANLTLDWWTLLTTVYDVAEVRVSENKDYVAGVTGSGTKMEVMDLTNGNVVGTYDAGAEQFAVDGDDNLKYVIGGTVRPTYRYLVIKNAAGTLTLIDDDPMGGALDSSAQIDSNPDASCVAFGSDGGDFILLGRTGDTLSTVLSGNVTAPIGAVEIGDQTLLVASGNAAIELYPGCVPPVSIEKDLLEGPEEIGIYLPEPTQYVFEIAYTGPAARVIDTVPAEFECVSLVPTAGTATCSDTSKGRGNSANRIEWDVPAGSNTLTVTIQTVASPGKGHKEGVVFKPTSCGPLPINDGATAFEVDPLTGELVLVEVVDPVTGEITLEPVVIVGPSNSLVVEAVEGAKPCEPVGCAGAVFDICVDGDGIASAGPGAFQIAVGDAVLLAGVGGNPAGLDLIDRGVINGVYDAGDDLMVEDPIGTPTCPTALRDAVYNNVPGGPQDCVVLDPDGSLADGDFVTCDAGLGCGLSFRDDDGDGRYDEGEDLIVDVNGNGAFD